jgi:NAD(P)-dependent dehydrogenase (short-subunit alcohol dehydrogenase family)
MATPSTIIITGGTGSLGSSLARAIETSYPGRFHLLLTCRNTSDAHAESISSSLKSQNAQFSLEELDLSDLENVKLFAERVKAKISAGEIPGLVGGGIVNSAAYNTFLKGKKGKVIGGKERDVMYTINCLAPALLVRGLVGVMVEGAGATVVNVGSVAYEIGRVDYFETQDGEEGEVKEGEKLAFMEGMKRYGSSKALSLMMGYAFQRRLYAVSCPLDFSE